MSSTSSSSTTTTTTRLTPTPSIESQAHTLAAANDVAGLEVLFTKVTSSTRQTCVDMALIGAGTTKAKEAGMWAIKNGATELWGIQQEPNQWHRIGRDSNRSLRMLGGPGEVSKGTFATSNTFSSK